LQLEKNKGMTLIEVVIVVVIIGIIMGVVYQIFITAHYIFTKSKIDEELLQNAQVAVDWITRDVRSAETLTVSSNQLKIENLKNFETGEVETIVYNSGDAQHSNSKVLYRSVNGISNPITTENVYVDDFSISPLSSGSITIGINFNLRLKAFDLRRNTYYVGYSGKQKIFILKDIVVYAKKFLVDKK